MGQLFLIAKPLVVGFAVVFFGISDNGISVLNTDCIIESADRSAAAPEVTELPVCIQGSGVPNDMVMDVRFINMSADDKGAFAAVSFTSSKVSPTAKSKSSCASSPSRTTAAA